MLGNNADAFFTTPMRTSVVRGGNAANALSGGMPAPYGAMPFGDEAPAQIQAETTKLFGVGLPVILGVAALAFFALKRA
jgi:hypothetical protein